MDSRKFTLPLNYEDFDPDFDQVQEPQVDTLLIYLPGFRKEEIRVQLTGTGILKISGQRRLEGDKWKRFLKQFQVSSNCDTHRISAKFESGTLYITQPKLIIPAAVEKPADSEEQKTKEAAEPKGGESEDSESDTTESENTSDKEGVGAASRTEPGEDDSSDKKAADDKRAAVAGKSDGEKSGGDGKAAVMDGYSGNAQLKRSRKMMNVALVVLLVVGVGLYLNSKMRSSSSNDAAGEL
ncbi:PREDICTED: inactive protein RESTRICTED TEV MOVEMENT 2-like [Ipomoea nil]|uniref:inactive protein RESTRICTED TEV MOVEMENT 2-like n=1 Tax=Ipomoea nil TaxID=35883 RepID=UPI0009019F19|nr:PREDICTED: inactive protein RESTRICTED TEV MOVEMENT 2-like [Ipomoea nil]